MQTLNFDLKARRLIDLDCNRRQSGYFPSIFATMKIRIAPPKPPPKSKYKSEYPAAARTRDVAKIAMMDSLDWTVIETRAPHVRRYFRPLIECKLHTGSSPVGFLRRLAAHIDPSDLASICICCIVRRFKLLRLIRPTRASTSLLVAANMRRSLSVWTVGPHVRIVAALISRRRLRAIARWNSAAN